MEFIKNKYNFISFAVALIPAMLLWIFQPSTSIPYWIFAIIILLCICLLWLALMAYFHYRDLKTLTVELSIINCSERVILCKPSKNIGLNVIVTIYQLENQYERVLGCGVVQNVQQNGLIQISILKSLDVRYNEPELLNHISANLNNVVIKSVATTDIIEILSREENNVI